MRGERDGEEKNERRELVRELGEPRRRWLLGYITCLLRLPPNWELFFFGWLQESKASSSCSSSHEQPLRIPHPPIATSINHTAH